MASLKAQSGAPSGAVAVASVHPRAAGAARDRAALVGTLALGGLVAAISLIALGTAAAPTALLPTDRTRPHYFPAWLAGPLHAIGLRTSSGLLVAAVIVFCACYAVALRCAARIPSSRVWTAIGAAHVAALLAPPLLSQDVFGYLGFARLAALHGLSPYAYTAAAAPHDAIVPLLGWTDITTPYGPLFTLFTQALVPFGIGGGLWVHKTVAALTSLATVAVIWRAASRLGHSPRSAAVFYGLNPLVIVFAVAGAHNETLFGLFLAAGALCVVSGAERRGAASMAIATMVKASAGLVLPFALLGARRRGRALAAAATVLVVALLAGLLAYGPHLLDAASAWLTQQHQVAGHSIPSQVSKLLGLGPLAAGVRIAFLGLFAAVLAAMLWRTWRGAWWLDCYGYATLALLAATAWIFPWYGLWALLPASLSANRRLRTGALIACAYLVAIKILVSTPLAAS
jgi:hypothetical protein